MLPTLPSLRQPEYQITHSLRFRLSQPACLDRTPSTPGAGSKWTFSCWVKRGRIDTNQTIFIARDYTATNYPYGAISFLATGELIYQESRSVNGVATAKVQKQTTQLFRDVASWYHIVVSLDNTLSTVTERVKMYVNGSRITSFVAAGDLNPTDLTTYMITSNVLHRLGASIGAPIPTATSSTSPCDAYFAEVHLVDGQALTPAAFGGISSRTGVWAPRKYIGTYGTNGFYLKFADNSNATATTIGKDSSGNNHNMTPTGISVAAGPSCDSMIDVPTPYADGGRGRGNYCTLNPLAVGAVGTTGSSTTANLSIYGNNTLMGVGTMLIPASGKWYFEIQDVAFGTGGTASVGVVTTSVTLPATDYCVYKNNGQKNINGTTSSYGFAYGADASGDTDVIGVAVDQDQAQTQITFYHNNASQGPITYGTSKNLFPYIEKTGSNAGVVHINFGQRPFSGTPPTGFKALNTYNLPEPEIVHGHAYMTATTYTGTGVGRNISNLSNNRSFQPDLVWIKSRSNAYDNALYDTSRGASTELTTNSAISATTQSSGLTAFNENGFGIGTSSKLNANGINYVAWQWKESITAGLDIVRYTGTGVNRTVPHNLGSRPGMIIVKRIDGATGWQVRHSSVAPGNKILLNSAAIAVIDATVWNNTLPDANNFTVGTHVDVNASGGSYVAYCFKPVVGFSAFSSYTGNASTNGPFIYCGFRPKWIMYKLLDVGASGHWHIYDTARDIYNPFDEALAASTAIMGTLTYIDVLSNGFKLRTNSSAHNDSTADFLFAAFAEVPLKYALAR